MAASNIMSKALLTLAVLLAIHACKKEPNVLKQPLLATKILGEWNHTYITYYYKAYTRMAPIILSYAPPGPIFNFLANGTCNAGNRPDIVAYIVKNDTLISFSGGGQIPGHEYSVKIIADTIMEWKSFAPLPPPDDITDLDYIIYSFKRSSN